MCRRIATHLVADVPDEALVDRLAAVYLSSGTRLDAVLRALFADPAFEQARETKVRRPLERYVATLRLLVPEPRAAHLGPRRRAVAVPARAPTAVVARPTATPTPPRSGAPPGRRSPT